MKLLRLIFSALLFCTVAAGLGGLSVAQAAAKEKCLECHDDDDDAAVALRKTKHGTEADSHAPTCTSCHGASTAHAKAGKSKPDRTFSRATVTPINERNDACLACHQKDAKRMLWLGSTHEARDLACSSCHTIHSQQDKVRDKRTQPDVCFKCHKEQRAQINKPSHHPIPEGKMGCADCHNVHGSAGPKLMKRDSVVETCYTCHMEKRGPFVHNHEPVNEDCSNCHNPHGTTAESLLKMRPPFLCNNCHTPHGALQPLLAGQVPAPGVVGWNSGSIVTQGRACMNCHTQIHGSNNPSGLSPTPQFLFR